MLLFSRLYFSYFNTSSIVFTYSILIPTFFSIYSLAFTVSGTPSTTVRPPKCLSTNLYVTSSLFSLGRRKRVLPPAFAALAFSRAPPIGPILLLLSIVPVRVILSLSLVLLSMAAIVRRAIRAPVSYTHLTLPTKRIV